MKQWSLNLMALAKSDDFHKNNSLTMQIQLKNSNSIRLQETRSKLTKMWRLFTSHLYKIRPTFRLRTVVAFNPRILRCLTMKVTKQEDHSNKLRKKSFQSQQCLLTIQSKRKTLSLIRSFNCTLFVQMRSRNQELKLSSTRFVKSTYKAMLHILEIFDSLSYN